MALMRRANAQGLAAALGNALIDRESVCQKTSDLERTDRGGQLQPVVGPQVNYMQK
jgi:hypothetical protein